METPRIEAKLSVVSAYEIFMKDLPPTKWYIGNLLHEGACLLSGDPKVGKSYLALQVALAVAGSTESVCGSLKVEVHGRVLYLALDDRSEKRIHNRLHQLTRDEEAVKNIDFVFAGPVPSLAKGLTELLDGHLTSTRYEMVVLDTLGAVSDITSTKSIYQAEYQEAIKLQMLAQKHKICLLILHHTNKREFGDTVARASGSHGRTGGMDSVLLLSSQASGQGELEAKPRDGEESHLYLNRREDGGWHVREIQMGLFPPHLPSLNPERQEVKDLLLSGPKFRGEIAAALGLKGDTARKRLERMAVDGLVKRLDGGRYQWADAPDGITAVRPVQVSDSASGESMAA
jgi:hypothetical protein